MFNKYLMRSLKSFLLLFIFLCSTTTHAEIMLQTLQGEDIALSSLKGKWVFINYWESWCGQCVDEISELNRFYRKNKKHNVEVFAVNYGDLSLHNQLQLVKQFDIRYPSLQYGTVRALHLGNVSVVPVTFVLDPKGELSTTLYGGQTMESLAEAML
jgi:thiol-disulfide isomerase/thioredoxin